MLQVIKEWRLVGVQRVAGDGRVGEQRRVGSGCKASVPE